VGKEVEMRKIQFTAGVLGAMALLSISSGPALADGPRHWRGGEMHQFHRHDLGVWRGGYWHQGRHGGRFGWWWVVAGAWYFYPQPVYPYPDPYTPPVVVVPSEVPVEPAVPPVQYWYYCDAARAYYPYVANCPDGWRPVPAVAPQ
jgi:hypothetical protein